jgi:hypothetical protein
MWRRARFLYAGICVFLLAGSRIALAGAADTGKAKSGEIVFDLKYQGLSGDRGENEPRTGCYWGISTRSEASSPFTKSLNLPAGKACYAVQTRIHVSDGDEEWMALELDGDKAVALYLDVNGDGKFAPNEKMPPVKASGPSRGVTFATPDLKARTKDGKEFPYRFVVIDDAGNRVGEQVYHSQMLSPACVWEGTADVAGTKYRLTLLDTNFDGSFTEFGQDSCSLMPETEYTKSLEKGYLPRDYLSQLVFVGSRFYSLRAESVPGGVCPARVVLEESKIPLGRLAFEPEAPQGTKVELTGIRVTRGNEVALKMTATENKEWSLPIGSYEAESGSIRYGSEKPDEWTASFEKGPQIAVTAEKPCTLKLGGLKMVPRVVKESERYHSDAQPVTVLKKGETVWCSPEIVGIAGEKYGAFLHTTVNGSPQPEMRIVDANGKEVSGVAPQYG